MASALFSSRSSSGWPPPARAHEPANRNKTTTICLTLGLIFSTATDFFRSFQQKIDPAVDIRVVVTLEMQLRDVPQAQPAGQFVPQVMPGMLQGRQRLRSAPARRPAAATLTVAWRPSGLTCTSVTSTASSRGSAARSR